MAILMHLADRHPTSQLAPPPGTFDRAKLDQWMCFVLANIYEGELRKNYPQRYVTGDPEPVEQAADAFVMDNYAILEAACDPGPFFLGATRTILNLYLWMFVNWFEDMTAISAACPKIVGIAETVMNRAKIQPIHQFNFGEGLGWPAE